MGSLIGFCLSLGFRSHDSTCCSSHSEVSLLCVEYLHSSFKKFIKAVGPSSLDLPSMSLYTFSLISTSLMLASVTLRLALTSNDWLQFQRIDFLAFAFSLSSAAASSASLLSVLRDVYPTRSMPF